MASTSRRSKVGGAERGPELLDDLAARFLEGALETRGHFPPECKVVADHRDLPVAQVVVGPLAKGMRGLGAGPAGADDVGAPLALGDVLGRDDGKAGGHLLGIYVRRHGVADGGRKRPHEQMNALALHEAARLGEARRWLALVVLGDELDLAPGQAPALLLEEELHAVGHVLAVGRERTRLGQDEPDLDRALLSAGRARGK